MTTVQKGTRDTKLGWLAFLENTALSLYRLRKACPTICSSETKKSLRLSIELTYTAEKAIEDLRSRLTDIWGIKQDRLLKTMDLGPGDLKKRMNSIKYTDSHSNNSRHGQTKKSQKK